MSAGRSVLYYITSTQIYRYLLRLILSSYKVEDKVGICVVTQYFPERMSQ